jgi:hypothetical protein
MNGCCRRKADIRWRQNEGFPATRFGLGQCPLNIRYRTLGHKQQGMKRGKATASMAARMWYNYTADAQV